MVERFAPLSVSINDVVIDNDPASCYRGREVEVSDITDFGHCVVLTVVYDGNISYALRSDKVLEV